MEPLELEELRPPESQPSQQRVSMAPVARKAVVVLENIQKTYLLGLEGVPALRGVSLTVYEGDFVAVYGTSGGGKTTLLNVIGSIDKPTKGDMSICGTRVNANTPESVLASIRLTQIGFVFQTFNLLSAMTALENVMVPLVLHGVYACGSFFPRIVMTPLSRRLSPSERRKRASDLLARVGMAARLHHLPSQLSGGEQQRVTIARALANNPKLLLLDEPTGDLDTHNTHIVMNLLKNLSEQGLTLIMVTHDRNLKNFASRVVWMRDGKIQSQEDIPQARRAQMHLQLSQQLQERTENSTESAPRAAVERTHHRDPSNYPTQAWMAKRRAERRAAEEATPAVPQAPVLLDLSH
eukprot:TRINITY_DN368_c0_g1_i2.p1 TRINITY_DN368_c0_g1~~TRINITY_DN368_c0_g1_i2.p1  ORF type:complete len:362 (-),score=74.89 TRINITY_DN368_c0_g1_i2:35-1090(-)